MVVSTPPGPVAPAARAVALLKSTARLVLTASSAVAPTASEGIETSETAGHEEPTTTTEKAPVETTEANKSVATTYHNPKETASSIANAGASNRLGIVGCILVGGAAVLV
ncbi:hypothetical protein FOVG_16182 [Fusarium oxysporum f. sp. pisi HDV247]|uniref:Uncharacterized protein n=2 Tax=Fusarium oxysporum TaxID=5507 RepID=A0A8J5Q8C0_FUSOX|nr:hypothetical protein FOVG_16182 [Fusarium oxysporum f. sp. pisi HDV247]KAG7437096.1 hypothetical protein Forpi1262_v000015 [Fusarium oxysporum f. sp. raphani]